MYVKLNVRQIECTSHWMHVILSARHIECTSHWMHVPLKCTLYWMYVTSNVRHIECTSHWMYAYIMYVTSNVRRIECASHLMYVTYNTRHIECMTQWCTSHWMHVTFTAQVHKVWEHRVSHTSSSTRSLSTRSWVHKLSTQSWHAKFINEYSVNKFMNNIHINVYRHVEIHKRIHDVGWVGKTNAESLRCGVSGPVSLSSQQGVWPCSQNLHAFFSANRQKGVSRFCQLDWLVKWNSLMSVTHLRETGGDIFDSWTFSSDRPSLFQST